MNLYRIETWDGDLQYLRSRSGPRPRWWCQLQLALHGRPRYPTERRLVRVWPPEATRAGS